MYGSHVLCDTLLEKFTHSELQTFTGFPFNANRK